MINRVKKIFEPFFWSAYSKMGWDDRLTTKVYQEEIAIIVKYLVNQRKNNENILDAGCGTGNFSLALAKEGFKVVGIDFAQGMLEKAKKKAMENSINSIIFERVDLNQILPYPSNYFDSVICMLVLPYVKNPDFTINEFERVLKPGGTLIIRIMIKQKDSSLLGIVKHRICNSPKENISQIRYILKIIFRVLGIIGLEIKGLHRWSPEEFSKYLEKCSFVVKNFDDKTLFIAKKQEK